MSFLSPFSHTCYDYRMAAKNHKPPRRIIHTSDLHILSLNGYASDGFKAVIDLAIKSEAELLIIAGDLFDQNRIEDEVVEFVCKQIKRLPIPVALLPGNHDCLVPESVYNRKGFWQECTNLHIFRDGRGEALDLPAQHLFLWGKPHDSYINDVRPMEGVPQPENNGTWNILVAHGYVVQSVPRIPSSYLIKESEIQGTNWDYIALGHIPLFRVVCNQPMACYSGAPSDDSSALVVDLDEENGVQVNRPPL